jgi:hypothetical protein
MASPPIPPQLDHLLIRPFSFYPAILGIEHNEWRYVKATWSEILVVNARSSVEIWIARRYVGEVSLADDPVVIVSLNREMEYRGGMIVPCERRVIEMPVAHGSARASVATRARNEPAPIVGIRVASSTDKRVFRLVGAAVTVAVMLCVVAVNGSRQRVVYTAKDQVFTGLTGQEDRTALVAKFGAPASDHWQTDHWQSGNGALQYEALAYPERRLTMILMGADRESMRYIGAMDRQWRAVHSVALPSGGTSDSLLHSLRRF